MGKFKSAKYTPTILKGLIIRNVSVKKKTELFHLEESSFVQFSLAATISNTWADNSYDCIFGVTHPTGC